MNLVALIYFFLAVTNITYVTAVTIDQISSMCEENLENLLSSDDDSILDLLATGASSLPTEKQNFIRKILIDRNFTSLAQIFSIPLNGHESEIVLLKFSANSRFALTTSLDKTVFLWDLAQRPITSRVLEGNTDYIVRATISPTGKHILALSRDGSLGFWDLTSGGSFEFLESNIRAMTAMEFSPTGNYAITASGNHCAEAVIWNFKNKPSEYKVLNGHALQINSVAISPDDNFALTGSNDKTARLWDLNSSTERCKFYDMHEQEVNSVNFTCDGKHALIGAVDNTCTVWDLSGSQIIALQFKYNISLITELKPFKDVFSCTYSYESLICDARKRQWDISNIFKKDIRFFGKLALERYFKYNIKICDVTQKTLSARTFYIGNNNGGIAFSENGRFAMMKAPQDKVCLWDFEFSHLTFIQLIFACKLLEVKDRLWQGVPEILENEYYLDALKDTWFKERIEKYFNITFTIEN